MKSVLSPNRIESPFESFFLYFLKAEKKEGRKEKKGNWERKRKGEREKTGGYLIIFFLHKQNQEIVSSHMGVP